MLLLFHFFIWIEPKNIFFSLHWSSWGRQPTNYIILPAQNERNWIKSIHRFILLIAPGAQSKNVHWRPTCEFVHVYNVNKSTLAQWRPQKFNAKREAKKKMIIQFNEFICTGWESIRSSAWKSFLQWLAWVRPVSVETVNKWSHSFDTKWHRIEEKLQVKKSDRFSDILPKSIAPNHL